MKTKFCDWLSSNHLDQLFRLQLHASQPLEFPFHRTYENWGQSKHRRNAILQPDKQKIDIEDLDSDSSEDVILLYIIIMWL